MTLVFEDSSTQEEVYNAIEASIQGTPPSAGGQLALEEPATGAAMSGATTLTPIASILLGYNITIFGYGQKGSGKTYTMMGNRQQKGLIPRLVENIFNFIALSMKNINVTVSYMEIYQEEVNDLLTGELDGGDQSVLNIQEQNGVPIVVGLKEVQVTSAGKIYELMAKGDRARATSSTSN
ncbi:kinesin motor domain-containing protein [Blyttiomyces helicus]|uniref:Kinesin motor domain-containing protein n=1 Tax=Blyttiomyces helicus TaxID=388810 RepID=A0A4P9WG57_9FUNG|nr:kinesin motor domain-containing protein [Blyttiomyces helicus]|eukprot:RKO91664.1 kinesin motor domain-containing protein [Blyttiomyces helicus]